jgi:hypothetical protein
MIRKHVIRPDRLRVVPAQFSWVDHRLVREGHISKVSCEALALYLFLVTVSDSEGVSFWSDRSVLRRVRLDQSWLKTARAELQDADLIAYEPPLYQVLSLGRVQR